MFRERSGWRDTWEVGVAIELVDCSSVIQDWWEWGWPFARQLRGGWGDVRWFFTNYQIFIKFHKEQKF